MCCKRIVENTGRKKSRKIAIWAPSHNFVELLGYIFATDARIDNLKKMLSSNMSSRLSNNMVNLGPLAAETGLPAWGTPANFNGFLILAAILHGNQVVGVSQTLRR